MTYTHGANRCPSAPATVVVASLYPVIPVLLGITVLRERPTKPQVGGLLLAAVAVVLLGIG
ncbi:MAG: EamA family transporter [Micromonosporaceae bacterium]